MTANFVVPPAAEVPAPSGVPAAVTVERWFRLVGASFGAALLFASAQIGVLQGLGIVEWDRGPAAGDDAWRRMLTWVVFVFAAAVLGGVLAGARGLRTATAPARTTRAAQWVHFSVWVARVSSALAAGLGAAAIFPLVWVPIRANLADRPESTIVITAGAGILIGMALAIAALWATPIAVNVGGAVAWVWLFAIASTALALTRDRSPRAPRLGMIDAPQFVPPSDWWFGPYLMVAIAGALGLIVAGTARWISSHRLGVSLSGFAGPALVAAAYLVAGPTVGGSTDQLEPYVASLIAATVGLLASTVIAAAPRRSAGDIWSGPDSSDTAEEQDAPEPAMAGAAPGLGGSAADRAAVEGGTTPAAGARGPAAGAKEPTGSAKARGKGTKVPAGLAAAAAGGKAAAKPARPTAGKAPAAASPGAPAAASAKAAGKAQAGKAQAGRAQAKTSAKEPAKAAPKGAAPADTVVEAKDATGALLEPVRPEDSPRIPRQIPPDKRKLRKREREHIDWVQNLANIPNDPTLVTRRGT